MLGLLIQLLNIYTVRILRQQCEASITNARLSIKRNTQELFGCCAPRLTFTLLTIGSSGRQRQLLLHQHVLPASHAPCVCVCGTNHWHFHCATICVAWLEGRLFILSHSQHNKKHRNESRNKTRHGKAMINHFRAIE